MPHRDLEMPVNPPPPSPPMPWHPALAAVAAPYLQRSRDFETTQKDRSTD